ncbi:hypothetical protein TrCOL_g599 [Triparma columacea]|uniref:Uncharacterized protein n=1 Tax=Triparma columacea TaxID=722753 RepID=A0A9W7GFP9_9STRA|nr:hypothetical protein TrCOL_g599 [Triparma columacea]
MLARGWVVILALLIHYCNYCDSYTQFRLGRHALERRKWGTPVLAGKNDENGLGDDVVPDPERNCKKVEFTNEGIGGGEDTRKGPEDLTDRFKYSVNALMGLYDPPDGATDNEQSNKDSFAISNALLKFPVEVEFVAVGVGENFSSLCVDAMRPLLLSVYGKDYDFEYEEVPRGAKYTKFKTKQRIENAEVLGRLYAALDSVEGLKFKY